MSIQVYQQIQLRSLNAAGQSEVSVLRPGASIRPGVNTHTMLTSGNNEKGEIVTDLLTLNFHFAGSVIVLRFADTQ